jgi:hypothetical protein
MNGGNGNTAGLPSAGDYDRTPIPGISSQAVNSGTQIGQEAGDAGPNPLRMNGGNGNTAGLPSAGDYDRTPVPGIPLYPPRGDVSVNSAVEGLKNIYNQQLAPIHPAVDAVDNTAQEMGRGLQNIYDQQLADPLARTGETLSSAVKSGMKGINRDVINATDYWARNGLEGGLNKVLPEGALKKIEDLYDKGTGALSNAAHTATKDVSNALDYWKDNGFQEGIKKAFR